MTTLLISATPRRLGRSRTGCSCRRDRSCKSGLASRCALPSPTQHQGQCKHGERKQRQVDDDVTRIHVVRGGFPAPQNRHPHAAADEHKQGQTLDEVAHSNAFIRQAAATTLGHRGASATLDLARARICSKLTANIPQTDISRSLRPAMPAASHRKLSCHRDARPVGHQWCRWGRR